MTNKIALITGGSRGLGREMALRLAENGRNIVITYASQKEAAEKVVKEIDPTGKQAASLHFDANQVSALGNFVSAFQRTIQQKWNVSKFDFLINNAGIGATIPFEKATEEDFDLFMNIHFKSVYFLTQQLLPFINDHGRIINISSGTTKYSVPGYSIYASMKGAIETFTRYLAKEVASRGITVNVIAPRAGGNRFQ